MVWKKHYISVPRDGRPTEEYNQPEHLTVRQAEDEWLTLRKSTTTTEFRWVMLLDGSDIVMFWTPTSYMTDCGIALIYRRD